VGTGCKTQVIKSLFYKIYYRIVPDFNHYLKKELAGCQSVLDLGCGPNSPVQFCNVPRKVGVELFEPYIQESEAKGIHQEYIKGDIQSVEFAPKSFDAVILIDVLEHLTQEEAAQLLKKIEPWAKKKVIVYTPNGFVWQDGYDDNHLQAHKSGWSVKELENAGFKVKGVNGWKKLRGYRASMKYKPAIFWLLVSDLTHLITYHRPKAAFQLLAVKEL
jgi:SAM-dependent methyltransferase